MLEKTVLNTATFILHVFIFIHYSIDIVNDTSMEEKLVQEWVTSCPIQGLPQRKQISDFVNR